MQKKEQYKIYGKRRNMERKQTQKGDSTGRELYKEEIYTGKGNKKEEIIYGKKVYGKGIIRKSDYIGRGLSIWERY